MGLESKVQSALKAELERRGALVLNIHGSEYQAPGWPDLQIYHRMWTGHVELKVNDGTASDLQARIIAELRLRGTSAFIVRWWSATRYFTVDGLEDHQLHVPKKLDGREFLRWLVSADEYQGTRSAAHGPGPTP